MLELVLLFILFTGVAILAYVHQRPPQRIRMLAVRASRSCEPEILADQTFIESAAKEGIYGLLLGTLGIEKSQNPRISAFAESMVQENQVTIIELTSIARRKGISMAKALDPDQRRIMEQLARLSGPDFEDKFLIEALTQHRNTLKTFLQEKQDGKDKDLQKFAACIIPRLKIHIKLVKKAEANLEKS